MNKNLTATYKLPYTNLFGSFSGPAEQKPSPAPRRSETFLLWRPRNVAFIHALPPPKYAGKSILSPIRAPFGAFRRLIGEQRLGESAGSLHTHCPMFSYGHCLLVGASAENTGRDEPHEQVLLCLIQLRFSAAAKTIRLIHWFIGCNM